MTTFGIGGLSSNYGTTTAKTEDVKKTAEQKGEKVEGQRPPPPPPPKNQDTYVPSEEAQAALATMDEVVEEAAAEVADQVEETETEKTSYKIDKDAVLALKAELKENEAAFLQKMVGQLTGQANASLQNGGIWEQIAGGMFEITDEMQAEAAEAISEDGYWGVEETANRIFDMAIALSGGDPDKADEMMAAIEKGYAEAEKVWGGELPSITADTKTRVDELFAEWKGE